jgi:transglutaminase-like putative cysteine protease
LTAFAEHIKEVVRPTSVLALVRGARSEVHRRFAYLSGSSYVSSTVDDLLERGSGVCQDFAHLSIATLRELGVPARYVSGYFYAGPMPPLPDQTVDVVSHAWVEALVPGTGWVGLDPTNDCPPDERHVTVAVGRDYSDVAPVSGVMHGGAGQILEVSVTMVTPSLPLDSTPGAGRRPGPRELPGGDQQ